MRIELVEQLPRRDGEDRGLAVILVLIALAMLSLLGLYLSVNAGTELRISDNYESEIQARFAARAGINHAREALRGLSWDDVLAGPDGMHDTSPGFIEHARTFGFRNFVGWETARSLNVPDPLEQVRGIPDDGLVNTGRSASGQGGAVIPALGVPFYSLNPAGTGPIVTVRYFVKASDNNGESSELAGDPADNPFVDGDGVIIVRSVGVARTFGENVGSSVRSNSISVYEARFRRKDPFLLGSPVVVEGNQVTVSFPANGLSVAGGMSGPGIGVIDTDPADAIHPDEIIRAAAGEANQITGAGLSVPSVRKISLNAFADPVKAKLADPGWLHDFVQNQVPKFADPPLYRGPVAWSEPTLPDLGSFDPGLPPGDPVQHPRVTHVQGDLIIDGTASGGGLLVVTGDLSVYGNLRWAGLILVVGSGRFLSNGANLSVQGGIFVANISMDQGTASFGSVSLIFQGPGNIVWDQAALQMAHALLPPCMISYREITPPLDP